MDKNLSDLIDTTHLIHYAKHRGDTLRAAGKMDSYLECDDTYETSIEEQRRALLDEIQSKEEEMRQRFVTKVKQKEQELREREEKLNATRQRMLEELEGLRKTVEAEKLSYEELLASRSRK